MAKGVDVEWVRAAKPGEPSKPSEDLEAELRELRDEVRRLRERVAALAVESARPAPGDERLPTYVGRLDASLEGGVPKGSVIAITGPGGSMKTSLALYILIKNRTAGRRGVYVTVEESRESILRTMRHRAPPRGARRRRGNPGLAPRLERLPRPTKSAREDRRRRHRHDGCARFDGPPARRAERAVPLLPFPAFDGRDHVRHRERRSRAGRRRQRRVVPRGRRLRTPIQRRGRGKGPTPLPMREDAPHEPFSRLLRPDVRQRVRSETVRRPEAVPLAPADVIRRRP